MSAKTKKKPKAGAKTKRLTVKQEAFCVAYVALGTGAAAYREAYDVRNMKPGSIWNEASRLLDNLQVSQRINQLQANAAARAEISAGRVLREYGKLAFLDIRKAFDVNGNLKPIADLDDATAAAVSGLEFEEVFEWQEGGEHRERVHTGRIHKIKLSDKKAALDSLAKHLGMGAVAGKGSILEDGIETGTVTFEEFLTVYRRRTENGSGAGE